MSDLILRFAALALVARHSVAQALVNTAEQASDRFTREEAGQDMVEYAGVLLVVAIIVAAVVVSPIGGMVKDAVTSLVSSITNGNCPSGKTC